MKWWSIFFFVSGSLLLTAQKTDSLWAEFNNESLDSITRIRSLHRMAMYVMRSNPDSAFTLALRERDFAIQMRDSTWIAYAYNNLGSVLAVKSDFTGAMDKFYRLLDIRLARNDTAGIGVAYNNIGNIYYYKGDYPKALEFYIRSLRYEELNPTESGLAASYMNIGSVYALQDQHAQALSYFKRALQYYIDLGDENGIASCYSNMGNTYHQLDSLALARNYFLKSINLMNVAGNKYGLATAYLNLAKVYHLMSDNTKMFDAYTKAERIREQLGDQLGLATVWINRGTSYVVLEQFRQAQKECAKALPIAESHQALTTIKDACDCLYHAHKGLHEDDKALTYFERHNQLKDSMAREETLMRLQVMEFRNQVKEDSIRREAEKQKESIAHQAELHEGYLQRNVVIGIGVLLVILSFFLYRLFRKTHASKEAISREKQKADELLLNILPAEITEQLMQSGKVEAQQFDNVTILFTDIVGFTQASEHLPPQDLLVALNDIYSHFDEIVSRHGIEKIKSIGDAYMAAGGLPVSDATTVKKTVIAGLEIQEYMRERKAKREKAGLSGFEIRIGIHTGPVVAGIIGVKKFQYDVWGDTVNTANRMEKNGAPGRVNISQSTYDLIANDPDFTFEQRMKIPVKGKGEMQMYFVERKK